MTTTAHFGSAPMLVKALKIAAWANAQRGFPTYEAVMTRFGCSHATAQRWLNALAEARGIERPVHPSRGNQQGAGA